MKRLLSQLISAIVGLWVAMMFAPGVIVRLYPESNFFGFPLTSLWQIFLLLGILLGLLNYFTRIFLKNLFLPLEILTLGTGTIIAGGGFLWLLDTIFDEFYISQPISILYTAIIIWLINIIVSKLLMRSE